MNYIITAAVIGGMYFLIKYLSKRHKARRGNSTIGEGIGDGGTDSKTDKTKF